MRKMKCVHLSTYFDAVSLSNSEARNVPPKTISHHRKVVQFNHFKTAKGGSKNHFSTSSPMKWWFGSVSYKKNRFGRLLLVAVFLLLL
jgi:hypothetical protein